MTDRNHDHAVAARIRKIMDLPYIITDDTILFVTKGTFLRVRAEWELFLKVLKVEIQNDMEATGRRWKRAFQWLTRTRRKVD